MNAYVCTYLLGMEERRILQTYSMGQKNESALYIFGESGVCCAALILSTRWLKKVVVLLEIIIYSNKTSFIKNVKTRHEANKNFLVATKGRKH